MPEQLVQVTILIDQDTAARYRYAGERRGRDARGLMAEDLHASAEGLPQPPRGRRTMRELRDESRDRNGGISAHTAVLNVIPPRERT